MGFRDHLRAVAEQAKAAAAELAEAQPEAARKVSSLIGTTSELKDQALLKVDTALADFSETERGQATVRAVVRAQEEMARLPGVTALSDTSRSFYGVTELGERVTANPDDAWGYLWLAEALIKMKRAQQNRARVRAAAEPSSMITRAAFVTAARVAGEGMSLEERLLRRAYALSCRALRSGPAVDPLHVLARVYAAVGSDEHALVAVKPAVLLAGEQDVARAWVTYARLLYAAREHDAAAAAAQVAVERGSTLGHQVLADVHSTRARGGVAARAAAVQRAAELAGLVTVEDLVAYHGVHQTAWDAAAAAMASQKMKAHDAAARVRRASTDSSVPPQQSAASAPAGDQNEEHVRG